MILWSKWNFNIFLKICCVNDYFFLNIEGVNIFFLFWLNTTISSLHVNKIITVISKNKMTSKNYFQK